jgi:hypothetical protein
MSSHRGWCLLKSPISRMPFTLPSLHVCCCSSWMKCWLMVSIALEWVPSMYVLYTLTFPHSLNSSIAVISRLLMGMIRQLSFDSALLTSIIDCVLPVPLVPWGVGYITFHLGLATVRFVWFMVGSWMMAMLYHSGLRFRKKCCCAMLDLLRFCCQMRIVLLLMMGMLVLVS